MHWIYFLHILHLFCCLLQLSSTLCTSFFLCNVFITDVTGDFYTKDTHWCPFLTEDYNTLILWVLFSFCAWHGKCTYQQQAPIAEHQNWSTLYLCIALQRRGYPYQLQCTKCALSEISTLYSSRPLYLLNIILSTSGNPSHFLLSSNSSFYTELSISSAKSMFRILPDHLENNPPLIKWYFY